MCTDSSPEPYINPQDGRQPRELIGKEVAPRTGLAGIIPGGGALPKMFGGNAKKKKKYEQMFDDAVKEGLEQWRARGTASACC